MPRRAVPVQRYVAPKPRKVRAHSSARRNPAYRAGVVYTGTATNSGTVATNPTITVTGPVTPTSLFFENATAGKTIWINCAVGSGQTLTVDFGARTVRLNSTVQTNVLTADSRWWDLASGANTLRSNVAAAVTWRNAYSS